MSTQERKVQLGVGVDASGAKAGFDQVKAGAKDMAQAVAAAGKEGAKGMDGIGAGAEGASDKLDKATRSIIGSVQRATAALQAGERGSAAYFQTLAAQRGVSGDVLKPYLDQLRQAEAAQQAASGSLNKMGISASQTTAALRQVPAQFTDIIVSLQSGQAPLTVLLQQGGQLKDMFGGVGNAARALGGYVASLVNPYTVAAAAVGTLAYGFLAGSKEAENHARALTLSGNAAGVTSAQLQLASQRLGAFVGTQGQAAVALDAMAQSGAVGAANLERFTLATIQWERTTGTAVEETVAKFAELKKAPLEASLKLNESMNYLTTSLYSQIKALDEAGRSTEAADLAQKAFADTINARAGEMEKQLGLIERSWRGIKDAVLGAGDALLNVGRPGTVQDELTRVQNMIATKQSGLPSYAGTRAAEGTQREIDQLRVIEASLQERIRLEGRSARLKAEQADLTKLLAGYEKEQEQYKTKAQRRDEEIQRAREVGAKLIAAEKLTEKQLELDIANIREKYADKSVKTARAVDPATLESMRAYSGAIDQLAAIQSKGSGAADSLSKSQIVLRDIMGSPQWETFNRRKQEEIILAAASAQAAEDEGNAKKQLAKAQAEFANARDAELKRMGAEIVAIEGRAQALEDEVLAYGLGKQAVEAMTVARLEERRATLQLFDGSQQQIDLLEQEIAARKRLAAAQDALDQRQASDKAAKKAQEDWQRAADKIESSITDALMRGFESGKSFAENLRDTVVNMFKTLVLRPVVSAVVSPIAGLLAGGGSAAAAAGQGVGSAAVQVTDLLNTASQSQSFINLLNGKMADVFSTYAATAGKWLAQNTSGILQQAGSKLYAYSGTIGTAGAYLGGATAGYGIGTAISGGRSAFGDGNQDVATVGGTVIGAIFGGPVGAAIGGAIGGVINRAFGQGAKEINASGIQGTFSGSSFSGQSYQEWSRAGGWFRSGSSGTDYSALDGAYAANLGKVYGALTSSTAELASALGLPTAQILGYVKSIRVDSSQLNEAGIKGLFEGIADELARTVVSPQYIREAERASTALTRLVTSLGTVNSAFDLLDKTALSVSLAGGDSASKLVDLLGGTEKFNATTLDYYQLFYTEAERNAKTTEQLVAQFAGLGLALPASVEEYRNLVKAQDVTTESGRNAIAALFGMAGAFYTVTNAANKAVQDLIKASDYTTYVDYASAVSAAGGTPIPRFAGGGDHTGGLRVVGEKGWELEAVGPSRVWNQQQLSDALTGGGAVTAAEVAALREDQRAQSAAFVARLAELTDIVKRWEVIGMPEVRTT